MDYAKLLAHGVGSWLQYEQACGHSGLFSEKYLAQPIGHILSGRSGNRALAEYAHPVLVKTARGPGRRPAIDFAICNPYPKVEIGVESKWIGKTRPDVESIVWDLMRLELLVHHEGARCFLFSVESVEIWKAYLQINYLNAVRPIESHGPFYGMIITLYIR
jgi:hypothetical protein